MSVDLIDLDALAHAARQGTVSWFEEREAELGFAVSADVLPKLLRLIDGPPGQGFQWSQPAMTVQAAFSVMLEASHGEAGVAVAEVRRMFGGKDVVLAYRSDTHLHVSIRYASNLPMRMGDIWEGLRPWYKDLARNRKRLASWSAAPQTHTILALPRVARAVSAPTSDAGEELLAAVIAHPEDVGARLVYADWLVEQGDAQGQLIQLSEALAPMTRDDQRFDALRAEVTKLTAHFGERIAGDAGRLAKRYQLSGGFVDQVEMSASTFATHFERLSKQHPIRQLTLTPVNTRAFRRLARTPALQLLRALELRRTPSPPALSLVPLFESPYFGALEALELTFWDADADAYRAFSNLEAAALRHLRLHQLAPLTDVMNGLSSNPHVRLHSADIWGDEGFDGRALQTPAFVDLRDLALSLPVDDSATVALASATLPHLWSLRIHSTAMSTEAALTLLRSTSLTGLRALRLHGPRLDAALLHEAAFSLPDGPLEGLSLPRLEPPRPELQARFDRRFSPAHRVTPPRSLG